MAFSEDLTRLIDEVTRNRQDAADGLALMQPTEENWQHVGFLTLQLNIAHTQSELLVHIATVMENIAALMTTTAQDTQGQGTGR